MLYEGSARYENQGWIRFYATMRLHAPSSEDPEVEYITPIAVDAWVLVFPADPNISATHLDSRQPGFRWTPGQPGFRWTPSGRRNCSLHAGLVLPAMAILFTKLREALEALGFQYHFWDLAIAALYLLAKAGPMFFVAGDYMVREEHLGEPTRIFPRLFLYENRRMLNMLLNECWVLWQEGLIFAIRA